VVTLIKGPNCFTRTWEIKLNAAKIFLSGILIGAEQDVRFGTWPIGILIDKYLKIRNPGYKLRIDI